MRHPESHRHVHASFAQLLPAPILWWITQTCVCGQLNVPVQGAATMGVPVPPPHACSCAAVSMNLLWMLVPISRVWILIPFFSFLLSFGNYHGWDHVAASSWLLLKYYLAKLVLNCPLQVNLIPHLCFQVCHRPEEFATCKEADLCMEQASCVLGGWQLAHPLPPPHTPNSGAEVLQPEPIPGYCTSGYSSLLQ